MTYETPVGANMFAYCMNNPVSMADNDGEAAHIVIGAVLGAAFGALDAYISGENVLAGIIIGGIGGGVCAATGPVISVVVAAGEEILSQSVQHYIKQQKGIDTGPIKMDWASVATTSVTAAVGSGFGKGANELTKNLLESDKAAKSVFEYFSGLVFGVTESILGGLMNNE